MATEPTASVHFELTPLHFEGLSPRSRNIGGALRCDRRFQLGVRAMTAVGTSRQLLQRDTLAVIGGKPGRNADIAKLKRWNTRHRSMKNRANLVADAA